MILISRRNAIPILAGALLLAGCSEDGPTKAEKVAAASVPGAPPQGAADEAAKNAAASNVSESDELVEFAYAYPVEAARIPESFTFGGDTIVPLRAGEELRWRVREAAADDRRL